jgi:hypothetical protein
MLGFVDEALLFIVLPDGFFILALAAAVASYFKLLPGGIYAISC